ncbi:MAG: Hint domain-containing protein [Halocynthiibacter sp.]
MANYDVKFYDFDPLGVIGTSNGDTFVWSGPQAPNGLATITDNGVGIAGTGLEDDSSGENATGNVSIGGNTSLGSDIDAENAWTLLDTVTGLTFQVVRLDVENGAAAGDYLLSETPLVQGRTYEVVEYDSNPDIDLGAPAFTYADYVAANNVVSGTAGNDTIDNTYAGDPEGDMVDDGNGGGTGNDNTIEGLAGDDTILSGAGDDLVYGGGGSDTVLGGAGNDTIYGDSDQNEAAPTPISISSSNYSDTSNGYTVTAQNVVGGALSSASVSNVADGGGWIGAGGTVSDTDSGVQQQTAYDVASGLSETLIVDFDDAISDLSFTTYSLQSSGYGEVGHYALYNNGTLVYETDFTDTTGTGIDTFSVSGHGAFNQIVFTGLIQTDLSDGSDYGISDLTFTPLPSTTDAQADIIDGGLGNDTIFGEGGDDNITGGSGDDIIDGGLGADTIDGGADNDQIYGAGGADNITGGSGDDVIYGDSSTPPTNVSEFLDWSALGADGADLSAGVTQTTGEMDVSLTFSDDGNNSPTFEVESFETGYVDTGEPFDPNSQLDLYGVGDAATSTTTIDFAATAGSSMMDEVQNVTFRINDIDWGSGNHQDIVTVNAVDALGNPVTVTITPDGTQSVAGNTITADFVETDSQDAAGSVLIEIAGPLSSIEIIYSNALSGSQGIFVSDVHFDTIPQVAAGFADVIDGGEGDDTIFGEGGDDTILLTDNFGNDTITGGETDETNGDTLDTSGLTTGVNLTFTSTDGEDGTATVGGDTATFEEIENVIYTDQDDVINASATTVGMDIDAAGGDDTITGGSGADSIDGGTGDDTITGGTGADTLTGGTGADTFVYNAGDGADVITDFDTTTGISGTPNDPTADQTDNDFVDLSSFYDDAAVAAYNAANGGLDDITHKITLLREDAADGTLDGIINGVNVQGEISGLNLTLENGGAAIDPVDLHFENTAVTCFGRGTLISTKYGEVPVENLSQGDLVLTVDNGWQPIRWIGSHQVPDAMLAAHETLRPVRIRAGALGASTPTVDMIVSPQHRVLVRSKIAQRMFGEEEVLVAAKQLLALDGIDVALDQTEVEYFHFMFDQHEVVYSNGALTESLYTGPEALKSVSAASRSEILELFPELTDIQYKAPASRMLASGRMGRKLAARHVKNCHALVNKSSALSSPNHI